MELMSLMLLFARCSPKGYGIYVVLVVELSAFSTRKRTVSAILCMGVSPTHSELPPSAESSRLV